MRTILRSLLHGFISSFRGRGALLLEIMALRHQLEVLQRTPRAQARLTQLDRAFWVLLYRVWSGCLGAIVVVKPDTVVRWHRKGFRTFWAWKSLSRRRGRPTISAEVKALIRRMSREKVSLPKTSSGCGSAQFARCIMPVCGTPAVKTH